MTLRLHVVLFFVACLLLSAPFFVDAAVTTAANPQCVPWDKGCPCGGGVGKGCKGAGNKANCPVGICKDTVGGGKVDGICVAKGKCEGKRFTNQKGQGEDVGDLKGFMDIVKGVMDLLKKEKKPKDQQQQPQQPGGTGQQGCTRYVQVTVPSADPCAYYVPPTSTTLLGTSSDISRGATDALTEALSGGGALNVSESLLGTFSNLPSESESQAQQGESASTSTGAASITETVSQGQVNLQSGTRGDIVITDGGATIYAQARDAQANTEVAGFYGSTNLGSQPQGIISGLCKSRPWGSAIVSFVIPPTFFDSLCSWRGYQVGKPAPSSAPVVQKPVAKSAPVPAATTSASAGAAAIQPQVDIWAVPEKVPLGTRTSIFWNTKGVQACSITSPDGSFSEDSLSGGAATVPLSGPTTFTISCLTPTGSPATDYVTVQLTI